MRNATTAAVRTTLIITTYNQPEFLSLVLETVASQKIAPYETIIADDGSNDETAKTAREFVERFNPTFPVIHSWRPDDGFTLNSSRNNALALARGDYVAMIDGDCFLSPHFIADHIYFARRGRYVGGTRVNIGPRLKRKILETRNVRVGFFTPGTTKKFHAIRSLPLALALSGLSPEKGPKREESANPFWRAGVAGANLAYWRDDALAINGFNEALNYYGGNDLEFAARLEKSGVARFHMAHYGAAYHFQHQKPYGTPSRPRLTPVSPEYLASLESKTRCRDDLGVSRALRFAQDYERPARGYYRFNFTD